MSTNANLPAGQFITSINGKRCTAVPRNNAASSSSSSSGPSQQQTTVAGDPQQGTTATSVAVEATSSTSTASTSPSSQTDTTPSGSTTSTTSAATLPISTSLGTSSSSSSSSISPSTSSIAATDAAEAPTTAVAPAPAVQPTEAVPAPPPTPASSTLIDSTASTTQVEQAPATQTSEADDGVPATSAAAGQTTSQSSTTSPPAAPQSDTSPSPSAGGAAALLTTIGTAAATTKGGVGAAATGAASPGTVSAVPSGGGKGAAPSAVAVAGGVIGGVAALGLIVFLVWFWRRRLLRRRRSTLLTPLSADMPHGSEKQGGYEINRGSIGPTARTEKLRAALEAGLRKLGGRVSQALAPASAAGTPTVDMNRGNSQFMEVATHSRHNSVLMAGAGEATVKERVLGWWSGTRDALGSRWKPGAGGNRTLARGADEERARPPLSNKPDFLTLLSMDEDREAQQRRAGRASGRGASAEHFLGGLDLDLAADPFGDANATPHQSAKPPPLKVGRADNPFGDANAIAPRPPALEPTTYVADVRRSRGQSGGAASRRPPSLGSRGPSTQSIYIGMARESLNSVDSFGTRRNKFRSDPFDLEPLSRPGMPSGSGRGAGRPGDAEGASDVVRKPVPARGRRESYSSKYSSGVSSASAASAASMGDWADPGPDVGPATRRDGAGSMPTGAGSGGGGGGRAEGRGRSPSGGSQGSVGKAL